VPGNATGRRRERRNAGKHGESGFVPEPIAMGVNHQQLRCCDRPYADQLEQIGPTGFNRVLDSIL
jgi:hypothetical protein